MTGALGAQPPTTSRIDTARPDHAAAADDRQSSQLRTGGCPSPLELRLNPIEQPPRHVRVDRRAIAVRYLTVNLAVPVEPDEPIAIGVLSEVEFEGHTLLIEGQARCHRVQQHGASLTGCGGNQRSGW